MERITQESDSRYAVIPHTVEEVRIECGRFTAVGDLILPQGEGPHPVMVLVWGSGPMTRQVLGRPSPQVTRFLEAGFGVFIEDKPGFGASTGAFDPERELHERAGVLNAELEAVRAHGAVDSKCVGVYGASQAGYVIALALSAGARIDFTIAAACAVSDGVDQSGYLIQKQILLAGHPASEAAKARAMYAQRCRATDYAEYMEAAEYLHAHPIVNDQIGWGGILTEDQFTPYDENSRVAYDPSDVLENLDMPVLALIPEHDTQVDPVQAMALFTRAREQSGHPLFRVAFIHGADHIMRPSETGSLREQRERYGAPGSAQYVQEYLDTLGEWLLDLRVWSTGEGDSP